jgi:hypothetical protein
MTLSETTKLLSLLCLAFNPGERAQKAAEMAAMYHRAWEALPFDVAQRAVDAWLATGRFFPAPSEIRRLALCDALDLPPAPLAWDEVRKRIADVGHYGVPRWSTAVLERAVRAVGWRSICLCDDADLGTLRAQFRRAYEAALESQMAAPDVAYALEEASARRKALALGPASQRFGQSSEPLPARSPLAFVPPITEQETSAHEEEQPEPPKPVRDVAKTLAILRSLPGWNALPAEYRRRLMVQHGLADDAEVMA